MELTIERAALLRSLGHVQSGGARRTTLPILGNVELKAQSGALSLRATDMDVEVAERVVAEVRQEGANTVPAHTLYDIVRKLPDGAEIEIDGSGGTERLIIRSGRSVFTLSCLPPEDFPVMNRGEPAHRFPLSATALRTIIDHTRFAISTEETRYYLNGIYLHAAEADGTPVLRAVATDGHRLARVDIPLPEGAEGMPGVIVPRKTVNELRKLVDETDAGIETGLSESRICFTFDDSVLTSKLIDGTFPDYEKVIPVGNDKVVDVACKAFEAAVDRVSTISTDKSRAVKLRLIPGGLTLSATSADAGTATEEIEARYTGEPLEIGFNARYVIDIAQQIEGEDIRFVLADAASPVLVQDTTDASAVYVLMPMRV
jgi:DNA polymerase-3 subunit beta